MATFVPIFLAADLNGGITNLGFTQTEAEEEYKIKPDYITGNLFVGHRQDMWMKCFKYLNLRKFAEQDKKNIICEAVKVFIYFDI